MERIQKQSIEIRRFHPRGHFYATRTLHDVYGRRFWEATIHQQGRLLNAVGHFYHSDSSSITLSLIGEFDLKIMSICEWTNQVDVVAYAVCRAF